MAPKASGCRVVGSSRASTIGISLNLTARLVLIYVIFGVGKVVLDYSTPINPVGVSAKLHFLSKMKSG